MSEDQTPSRGHVPVPTGGGQTDTRKFGEELLFSFLNIAANEVPILGSVLSEARLHRASRFMERRLLVFIEELKEQMRTVEEASVDWEFVRSEDFFDLLRQAVEVVIRSRDQQKIEFVARVLRGATVEGSQDGYSPEEYLSLISDLTPKELKVAHAFYKVQPEMRDDPWRAWKNHIQTELKLDEGDLSIILSRVASSGLIELVTAGRNEKGAWVSMGEPGDAGYYRVAPAFEKLMRFLFPA